MYASRVDGTVPTGQIAGWLESMRHLDRDVTNTERIDQLRALEELKAAAAAAQARISVDLLHATRAHRQAQGIPATEQDRGVGQQIALARRESPARGGRHLGFATALTEMPHTSSALTDGHLSEWRATLLVRESACLSREDRTAFDSELFNAGALDSAGNTPIDGLGDRALVARAKQVAYRLDAQSVIKRARHAQSERRVSIRPAPDTMTYVTALLPVAQGVAVYAALTKDADSARASGDERTRGQVMADTMVQRVTGQAEADDVPCQVHVVLTDRTLLQGEDEPAQVPGYGVVPAQWAREHISGSKKLWLRRLYTAPSTGQLVAMESTARKAPKGLANFIDIRDGSCRTPWCDAPIRHRDHVVASAAGGDTSAQNLQGLCEQCNYTKQAPGWQARAMSTWDEHRVEVTAPTGHRYRSLAPSLPRGSLRQGTGPPATVHILDVHRGSDVERSMAVAFGELPRAG